MMLNERGHIEVDSGSMYLKEKGEEMQGREKFWKSSMTMS